MNTAVQEPKLIEATTKINPATLELLVFRWVDPSEDDTIGLSR